MLSGERARYTRRAEDKVCARMAKLPGTVAVPPEPRDWNAKSTNLRLRYFRLHLTGTLMAVLDGRESWRAEFEAGWLKNYLEIGELDWKIYRN